MKVQTPDKDSRLGPSAVPGHAVDHHRETVIKVVVQMVHAKLGDLETTNSDALDDLLLAVGRQTKDWERYHRDAVLFHRRNAVSWANEAIGIELTLQIDPEFSMSEALELFPIR